MPINRVSADLAATLEGTVLDTLLKPLSAIGVKVGQQRAQDIAKLAVTVSEDKAIKGYASQLFDSVSSGAWTGKGGATLAQKFGSVTSGLSTFADNTKAMARMFTQPIVKAAGPAVGLARALGAKTALPFDKDVASLNAKLNTLRTAEYRVESYQQQKVTPLLNARTPQADAAAQNLQAMMQQVASAVTTARLAASDAISKAGMAQADITHGKLPANVIAVWDTIISQANNTYDAAMARVKTADEYAKTADDVLGLHAMTTGQQIQGGFQAAGSALWGAGAQAVEAAEKVGKGALSTVKMAEYLPYIVLGGIAIYLFSSGRQSGKGVGDFFRSAGRRVERL